MVWEKLRRLKILINVSRLIVYQPSLWGYWYSFPVWAGLAGLIENGVLTYKADNISLFLLNPLFAYHKFDYRVDE